MHAWGQCLGQVGYGHTSSFQNITIRALQAVDTYQEARPRSVDQTLTDWGQAIHLRSVRADHAYEDTCCLEQHNIYSSRIGG